MKTMALLVTIRACVYLLVALILGQLALGVEVVQSDIGIERECLGTSRTFGFSGSVRYHYNELRRRYNGCTVVRGNLEIATLDDKSINYDLSFLRTIHTVTGYVLIGLVQAEIVPLVNLQLIRGDNLFKFNNESYGLFVALNSNREQTWGMRQLLMPALREISNGKVFFQGNPLLCYINTIRWDLILHQHISSIVFKQQAHRHDCEPCDDSCSVAGQKHCWGPGPQNCQTVMNSEPCPANCLSGCYQTASLSRCCHHLCAGGCWGPSSGNCQLCKYYYYDRRCWRRCPPGTYALGQQCRS